MKKNIFKNLTSVICLCGASLFAESTWTEGFHFGVAVGGESQYGSRSDYTDYGMPIATQENWNSEKLNATGMRIGAFGGYGFFWSDSACFLRTEGFFSHSDLRNSLQNNELMAGLDKRDANLSSPLTLGLKQDVGYVFETDTYVYGFAGVQFTQFQYVARNGQWTKIMDDKKWGTGLLLGLGVEQKLAENMNLGFEAFHVTYGNLTIDKTTRVSGADYHEKIIAKPRNWGAQMRLVWTL